MPLPIAIPAIVSRLPWKWIGLALAVAGALWWATSWHDGVVQDVRLAAMQEQADYSAADFEAAWKEAEAHQANEIAAQLTSARIVNKEQTHALEVRLDRIGSDYAALRLRWKQAAARENPGSAGQDGTVAVPTDAGTDAFAAAKAAGWIPFDAAATLAEAADRAIAADDAKAAWWLGQCRAWRGPKPEDCR